MKGSLTIKQSVKHVNERQFDRSLSGPFITMGSRQEISHLMRVTQARFPRHQLPRSVATSITASGDTCVRLWLSKTRTQFYFKDVRAVYPAVLARAFRYEPDLPSILRTREPRNWWECDLLLFQRAFSPIVDSVPYS